MYGSFKFESIHNFIGYGITTQLNLNELQNLNLQSDRKEREREREGESEREREDCLKMEMLGRSKIYLEKKIPRPITVSKMQKK